MQNKKILIFLFFLNSALVYFLYRNSFASYFFQDDWFTLKISSARNLSDILNFFVPRTDVIYYRPLGMQVYFFIIQSLFGLNSWAFHITAFITHIINSVLIFLILNLLTKNNKQSAVVSILYATSAVHFIPFYWPSTYPFILGPGLLFSAFYAFLRFDKSGKFSWFFLSGIFFVLGFLTNEMTAVFPVLAFLYSLLFSKKRIGTTLIFFIISLLFIGRLIFFHPPTVGVYKPEITKTIFNNIVGFMMWTFNWPEEMKAQMMRFGKFNPVFVSEFYYYYIRFITTYILISITAFFIPVILLIIKSKNNYRWIREIIFGGLWYIVALLPVLFFPTHTFSYYLPISMFGFLLILTTMLFNSTTVTSVGFILSCTVFVSWIVSSKTSIDFNEKVHWAAKRGEIAKNLIRDAQAQTIVGRPVTTFYVPDTSESKLALNNQDALQVYFKNSSIQTIYSYPP